MRRNRRPAGNARSAAPHIAIERPDLDLSPLALVARLHRLANRLTEELVVVYRRFGLSEGEFDILATLRRSGGDMQLPAGDLAGETMVTTGAVSKRVDRLEAAGLVERRVNQADGRGRIIRLTTDGRRLIDEAFAVHIENEARLIDGLSGAQRTELEHLLRAWGDAVDHGAQAG